MNLHNAQPHQAILIETANASLGAGDELPPDFKANGFWQFQGQTRAGTLRRHGTGIPMAYFVVNHQTGEPPFNELTDVRFEGRHGLVAIGQVMKYLRSKDAGGQAECSELRLDGERCHKARFWQTYCKEHTLAKGFEITADGRICRGLKQDGEACSHKAKVNGYCAQHGKGAAPRETTTRLYELPFYIKNLAGDLHQP